VLPPPHQDLERRRRVWTAFADPFFCFMLDEEPDTFAFLHAAQTAVACGYSDQEVKDIFRQEVAPALARTWWRGLSAAESGPLERAILAPRRLGYWFARLVLAPLLVWPFAYWGRIKRWIKTVRECRTP